jgi:hypothetical protein
MTSRFISNSLALSAGSFLIVVSFAFRTELLGWIGFAAGCVVALTVLVSFLIRDRGIPQRALDGSILISAAWTIVASRTFAAGTLKWLTFTEGAVLLVLAFVGLVIHEVQLELRVRQIERHHEDGRVSLVGERTAIGVAR